ncbi:glycosyltransferase [Salinibacter ruber]|uniref:glycosyltransferase n=1 Tax=Salinibacter ruber TaxID=146919 RepID=UPI00216918D9|nr:glycosyltransferase involved in cell wall biosynthesis [Salinibacter ruber]
MTEADALTSAGYDVTVLGPLFSDELRTEDEELLADVNWTHRISVDLRRTISGIWTRLRRKAGSWLTRQGWETADALGYGVKQTLRQARRENADLYIGHEEVGTWVVWKLEQEGARVGVDFEDWHARDLLPEDRADRPVSLLETVERDLLHRSVHATTTSKVLAKAMADTYDAPKPTVLYNAFPWADREAIDDEICDRDGTGRVSIHWVSQTIGPGRGLDTLCQALWEIETPVQVHLRGECRPDYRSRLDQMFPDEQGHTLHLHELVSPEALLSRIAEHDIGMALEQYEPDSRNLTVTNKILHYLLGGLAVVATDTAGQKEVAEQADGAVRLFPADAPAEMAHRLRNLLQSGHQLEKAQEHALRAAREEFSWEQQVPRLLKSVNAALQ